MRFIALSRSQAEWLVDLLENCDPKEAGTWRHEMAAEIREAFGMATREQEQRIKHGSE